MVSQSALDGVNLNITDAVRTQVQACLDGFKRGNSRTPAMSPHGTARIGDLASAVPALPLDFALRRSRTCTPSVFPTS